MAVRPNFAGSPAIELNGLFAGLARNLQMPGYRVEQVVVPSGPGNAARLGANISISTMAARIDLGEPGPLLEWAVSLARGNPLATDGAALVLDANRKVQRRVQWSEGLITELKLPVLDASSKLGFSLDLTWQPSSVSYAKPGGERLALPTVKRKPILTSNFRLVGLPFDASFITKITLPTVTAKLVTEQTGQQRLPSRHYSLIDLGELRLEFAARSSDEALAWVQKLVADGRIADSEYLTLQVELLDASLKTVLASVTLAGCGLLRYEEDPIGTNTDRVPGFALSFGVGQLDLQLAKG
jgi:hypothetical protein